MPAGGTGGRSRCRWGSGTTGRTRAGDRIRRRRRPRPRPRRSPTGWETPSREPANPAGAVGGSAAAAGGDRPGARSGRVGSGHRAPGRSSPGGQQCPTDQPRNARSGSRPPRSGLHRRRGGQDLDASAVVHRGFRPRRRGCFPTTHNRWRNPFPCPKDSRALLVGCFDGQFSHSWLWTSLPSTPDSAGCSPGPPGTSPVRVWHELSRHGDYTS
jgi:hypothetical protein